MRYFHGTSADNLKSILKNGLNGFLGKQIWNCSAGLNYFWDAAKLQKINDFETLEEGINEAKRQAARNAEYSLIKSKNCRRIIIECDLSNYEICEDTSCRNMDGAVLVTSPIDPKDIINIWIDKDDLSFYKGYFASLYIGRIKNGDELISDIELSNAEIAIANAMLNIENCDIFEYLMDSIDKMKLVYKRK